MSQDKQTQGLQLFNVQMGVTGGLLEALTKGLQGKAGTGETVSLQRSEGGHKIRLLINDRRPNPEEGKRFLAAAKEFCCHCEERGKSELRGFHFDCSGDIIRVTAAEPAIV